MKTAEKIKERIEMYKRYLEEGIFTGATKRIIKALEWVLEDDKE